MDLRFKGSNNFGAKGILVKKPYSLRVDSMSTELDVNKTTLLRDKVDLDQPER